MLARIILLAVIGAVAQGAPVTRTARVVIVTGENTYSGHHWQETSAALKQILETGLRLSATIVGSPNFLASDELFGFDAAVFDFRNEKPLEQDEKARANLVKFLQQGKGLVLVHWASGAFPYWPEYANIAGRCQQRKHDVRAPFKVRIVNRDHAVTRGMQEFEADDELFFDFTGDRPIEILASARSVKVGKDQPMAFVLQYGRGRVFQTPLGHDAKALLMPGVSELLRRGTAWVVGLR